jgi:hypothetical protein
MPVVDFEERVSVLHVLARTDENLVDDASDVRPDGDIFRAGVDESNSGDALGKWRLRRRRRRLSQFTLWQVPHERSAPQKQSAGGDDWKDDGFHGPFSPPNRFIEPKIFAKIRVEQAGWNETPKSAQHGALTYWIAQARPFDSQRMKNGFGYDTRLVSAGDLLPDSFHYSFSLTRVSLQSAQSGLAVPFEIGFHETRFD